MAEGLRACDGDPDLGNTHLDASMEEAAILQVEEEKPATVTDLLRQEAEIFDSTCVAEKIETLKHVNSVEK